MPSAESVMDAPWGAQDGSLKWDRVKTSQKWSLCTALARVCLKEFVASTLTGLHAAKFTKALLCDL